MKYGLSEKQLKEITDILASYEAVEKAILFGSRAIDTYKEASDVDIAIKGENADWSLAMTIKDHLEEETYLPFFFDVVAYGSVESEELKRHIDGKGKVLFERGWSQWRECELREVAEVQTGPFGSQLKNEQYITGGTPVITVEHINNFRIDDFDYPSVTDEDKNRLAKYLLKAGDIIFTRVGSVDLSAFVKLHQDRWMFSSRMLRVRPIHEVDSRFLSYFFQQKRFREYILNISVGATMPSINTEILKGIPVAYPPLPEQKAIAEVLSALDDKIDLLHRQNKTLEQMAETLFRQWFVVEAGEDWEETTLGEVIETTSGGTPSRKNMNFYENGVYSWVKSKELTGSFILETEEHISDAALEKSSAKLLPKHSVLIAMYGATVGEYSIISNQMTCNQAICALKPNSNYPYTFLFMFVKVMKEEIINMAVGSAQQNISQILIKSLPIVAPNKKINEFHIKTKNSFEKIENNIKQIRTLQSLRNTLLPKLMSGEIRVKYDDK